MTRYLLDTVAVSELRWDARRMHPAFALWQQNVGDVWLSVITLNELRYGMRVVKRKDEPFAAILEQWYAQLIAQPQRFRILDVDRSIAELAADFRASHGTSVEGSLIAATAKVHNLTVATRNTSHFADCGVEIENPWEYSA